MGRTFVHFALALVAAAAAMWQAPASGAVRYHAPRTPFGQPDLQGQWTAVSMTDLEREPGLPLTFATHAQEAAFEARERADWRRGESQGLGQGVSEWHQEFDFARIDGRLRTSFIVGPADGRLPWSAAGLARYKALTSAHMSDAADNPETRSDTDRCLVGGLGSANPPMLNPVVSGGKQIIQTRDEVAILSEMNHDIRIIRLNARHAPAALHPWMGDSIGWWEGDTLVVETNNFNPSEAYRTRMLISSGARVVERFTRVAPDRILYAFEVTDPLTYTSPWKGEMPLSADSGRIFEYACHEGERDIETLMRAARLKESGAASGR